MKYLKTNSIYYYDQFRINTKPSIDNCINGNYLFAFNVALLNESVNFIRAVRFYTDKMEIPQDLCVGCIVKLKFEVQKSPVLVGQVKEPDKQLMFSEIHLISYPLPVVEEIPDDDLEDDNLELEF